ncbi:OLC1v1019650C1 [Oldenlandia corymbosa var. corymbosa]|uniref:OLC1v1019650C1 n=1 Tax=Oldenlandia corymbosa var. corymbosa TaxID=529605 RepID=A0AAV1EEX3_OLDCO|nr:OLC1v1019650C1 [Oldenlandia corymbosa var. corymbosa]
MDLNHTMVADVRGSEPVEFADTASDVEYIKVQVDHMVSKVDQFEKLLNGIEQFYSNANKKQQSASTTRGASLLKDKDKQLASFKRRQQDAARREAAAAKRMQDLMKQMGTIIRQITQSKLAAPFMEPVDVVGLELHDYYDIIEKPMDFSTIKSKMEAKDGTGYKNVREIYSDIRLIFKNAMTYNDEREDVHVMAQALLGKFEEKWIQLLPKVDEEDKKREEEEADSQFDMHLAQEAAYAKMARDLSIELDEADMHLEELREHVLRNCRKMSTEEKRRLGAALTQLSPEDLNKALLIVSQTDPSFQASAEEVFLDMDAQVTWFPLSNFEFSFLSSSAQYFC